MHDVYETCPVIDGARFSLRFVRKDDVNDLLEVYSDQNALPQRRNTALRNQTAV